MKTRVTLTIAPQVCMRARNLAKKQQCSVSSMVERLLIEVTGTAKENAIRKNKQKSFSLRWAGKGRISRETDIRTRRLREKYGISATVE
jgi:hypothetical protein